MEILEVDNSAVREAQIKQLKELKATRDNATVQRCLAALTTAAKSGQGNLLALSIEAAKARATLGEISDALEVVYGRYQAQIRSVSGIYNRAYSGGHSEVTRVREMADAFAAREGRRPRILIAKLGQDGHDRGAKVVATAMADMGFDVDIGPLFQTPEEAARDAVENDVHIVAMSSLAGGHKTLLPQLVGELKKRGREDILVVAGGVIPAQDYAFLYEHGAAAVFGPGTPVPRSAAQLLEKLGSGGVD